MNGEEVGHGSSVTVLGGGRSVMEVVWGLKQICNVIYGI